MFEIVTKPDFFFSSEGSFTCTCYCKTDDGCFPDDQWTDFAENVISWWVDSYLNAFGRQTAKFQFLFKDGPFWIDCFKSGDTVELQFSSSKTTYVCIPNILIEYDEIGKQLLVAAKKLRWSLYTQNYRKSTDEMNRIVYRLANHFR